MNTIKLIYSILDENPIKGTVKPYDALHFDLMLADKYGGFQPDDGPDTSNQNPHRQLRYYQAHGLPSPQYARQYQDAIDQPTSKLIDFVVFDTITTYNK